jgi:cell wall-associated NlpC family hydrolase
LQHTHHASPKKYGVPPARGFKGWGLPAGFCLFFLSWAATLYATQPPPTGATPAATAVSMPAAPAANGRAPSGTNLAVNRQARKPKPARPPLVLARTKAKAEAIAQELSPALPQSLEQEITKFFGLRYRYGGNGKGGIDCSALVQKVYSEAFGVELPRSSWYQSRASELEVVPADDLKAGDLLFFGSKRKKVDHVGMYLSNGYFLHAARSEGVTISRLDNRHWKTRFMFSKRLRGLNIEEGPEEGTEIASEMASESAAFAFSGLQPGRLLSSMDAGISLNDSLELILSGYFLKLLSDGPAAEEGSVFADHVPIESEPPEGGFRLAALLSPSEWFGLSPSISSVERSLSKDIDYDSEARQKIGLETWMLLPSSKVAVFMAAHVDNQENLLEDPIAISPDWKHWDVSLGLQYRLSDSLRFSLYSTHAYLPDSKSPDEDPGRSKFVMEDVGFSLNIRF